MKKTITLLSLLVSFTLVAQNHPTCDGLRYQEEVFANVTATTAVQYGEGTTIAGNLQQLFLDIYEPEGDVAVARPAIVLAFGGSFISGERANLDWLCEAYARRGYVAVTIDYRLYDLPLFPIPTALQMQDEVIRAVSDVKAAIRFLRADAATVNNYRIDTDVIFVGGISAGAIAAAHAAVLDETDNIPEELLNIINANGGLNGDNTANIEYSSEVSGYVNYSGALSQADFIDANDPPFVSVHDDMDQVVPYGQGFASVFSFDIAPMEGSQAMTTLAVSLGITSELMTIENSTGHVSYFGSTESTATVLDFSTGFLQDIIICPNFVAVEDIAVPLPGVEVYPNPASDRLYIGNKDGLDLHFNLFDGFGRMLGQWENAQHIDVSPFNVGFYMLSIENMRTGERMNQRVVLQ